MEATRSHSFHWDLMEKTPLFLIILYVSKWVCDKFISGPIARRNGFETKPPPLPPNPSLEKLYKQYGSATVARIISDEVAFTVDPTEGMTPEKVKEWLVLRRKQDGEPEADKFAYECFTAACYVLLNMMSFYILPRQSWFWDMNECLNDRSEPQYEVAVCYTSFFSFYVFDALILAVKKFEQKDYFVMRIHHFDTILLLAWLFYTNMTSFGCIILGLMEIITPFPYISRIGWRLKMPAVCDITFIVFSIAWICGRGMAFHHWIIRNYVIMRYNTEESSIHDFIKDFLLFILFIINAYWTSEITVKLMKKLHLRSPVNILKGLSKELASRD